MRFCVGDRVQVRDRDDEPWEKGFVKELVDGCPHVQPYSKDECYEWGQVQPLVIA